jgi:hypothetical protein
MKICSRCGNNLTWNRSFCPLCGGFLVEKPDEQVSDHHREQAAHTARQESARIPQPQPTAPLNENIPAEVSAIPDSPIEPIASAAPMPPATANLPDLELLHYQPEDLQPSSEFQSWMREIPRPEKASQGDILGEGYEQAASAQAIPVEPEQPLENDVAQQPNSASNPADFPPLGDTFLNISGLPGVPGTEPKPRAVFTTPAETQPLKDLLPPLASFDPASTPPVPTAQNEPPRLLADVPPQQTHPETVATAGPVEMSPASDEAQLTRPRIEQSKQPAPEPFLGIMKGSAGGRVDVIPQKPKDGAIQPTIEAFEKFSAPEEIKQRSDVPNMDMFSRKRGEGFMPPGDALKPQDGVPEITQAPQPPRVVGFTLPAQEPPKATAPAAQAVDFSVTLSQLNPMAPQQPVAPVPTSPPMGATQQPGAPTPPQQAIFTQPSAQITPMPTTEGTLPVTPPQTLVSEAPTPPLQMTPTQAVTPAEAPLPPAPPLQMTPIQAVTPAEALLPPAPPLQMSTIAVPPPVEPPPMPSLPVTPPVPQEDSTPITMPVEQTVQAPTTLPAATSPVVVPPQAAPEVPQAPQYSKFAELIPQSQQLSKGAGQQQPISEPSKPAIPPEAIKKADDSFPQFPMGEFLKMFPEARPE